MKKFGSFTLPVGTLNEVETANYMDNSVVVARERAGKRSNELANEYSVTTRSMICNSV